MRKYTKGDVLPPVRPSDNRQRFYSRFLTSSYLRHNILLLATNIMAGAFSYLLHPFLGRMMGVSEYGQVAALIALSLVLATPAQIIATIAAKYASSLSMNEDFARLNDFIRRLTAILLTAGVCISVAFIALSGYEAFFFHLTSQQGVILLDLTFIVSLGTPLNVGTLQGLQRFRWFAAILFLPTFLRLVFCIGFVLLGLGVNGAILGIVVSSLLAYLVSFQTLRRVLRGPRTPFGSLRSLWSYSLLATTAAAAIVLLYSIDTVLARHYLSAQEAGLYAALATIGKTVVLITGSVTTVMFPRIAALYERRQPYMSVVVQAVAGVLLLSAAVEVAFYLFPSLVTKLLFGQTFIAIAGLLVPYGMAMLLLAVGSVLIYYFLAVGKSSFVPIIFLSCTLEISLIVWHHAGLAQLVQAVLITNLVLVLALLITFILNTRRTTLTYHREERG